MPEILFAALSPIGHFGPVPNVTVLSGAAHAREMRAVHTSGVKRLNFDIVRLRYAANRELHRMNSWSSPNIFREDQAVTS